MKQSSTEVKISYIDNIIKNSWEIKVTRQLLGIKEKLLVKDQCPALSYSLTDVYTQTGTNASTHSLEDAHEIKSAYTKNLVT